MQLDEREIRGGWVWLTFAGGFAVCLSIFLYKVDNRLTYSDKEQKLGETLLEIRTAQSLVSPGVSDARQYSPLPNAPKLITVPMGHGAGEDADHSGH